MENKIFLDNSSATKPFDEVVDFVCKTMCNSYGNASSLHKMGIEAENIIKNARKTIAGHLKCKPQEIFFTSGGTESNNLAIRGYLEANKRNGKHIITTKAEHPSVYNVFEELEKNGYEVEYIDVEEDGTVNLQHLKNALREDTSIMSIIFVNNEIGTIQPIGEIVRIKNSINKNTCIHVDATQGFGKIEIIPQKTGIELMSVSSQKIHGPKGVGALYVDEKIKIKPIIFGGGQENNIRSGSENVSGIGGFGMATDMMFSKINENYKKTTELKEMITKALLNNFTNIRINSGKTASPYILNVSFIGAKAEVLLHHLEEKNIYISTRAACSSRRNQKRNILKDIGLKKEEAESAVRISFSSFNTKDDIQKTIDALKEILPKITANS